MMENVHTLLLRLGGPMQSWGYRSRFDNRDTGLEPTRSGVIGLLCAALGWERDADLTPFDSLRMGVRVDAPGTVMVDYQTANEFSMQSWRYYLADARFLVGLQNDDLEWLQQLEHALRNPVFPLFLGRKSFVPTVPITFPGNSVRRSCDLTTALKTIPWVPLTRRERRTGPFKLPLLLETDDIVAGRVISDVPRDFASRRFALRYVESLAGIVPTIAQEEVCICRN